MDKVTCIAYLLYHSSKNQQIREKAIQLLNGDASLHDLKRDGSVKAHLVTAESYLRKNKIKKAEIQLFVDEFMVIEV
ncbi:hypothetical protein [Neobacillus cucumis]|uniref:hypothetical protein n=1 Tax=Neobacillus cucumis TaxID=1740721 RepID=UPI0019640AFB|nr:hypothetical protein [Neobacillus cucumis]MBM7655033.1 hypothetical protein [Neobacillus cucumis]MED4229189.1 hypothetical protein [Neobacillus cucumis]